MYVVKRGFRNLGQMLTAGTEITDPAVIKHFKSRVGSNDIIVVTEQNYDSCKAYFKGKFGVDIPELNKPMPKDEAEQVIEVPIQKVVTPTVKAGVVAKATVAK